MCCIVKWYSFDVGESARPVPKMEDNVWLVICHSVLNIFAPTSHVWRLWAGEERKTYPGFSVHWSVYTFNSFHRSSFATLVPDKA